MPIKCLIIDDEPLAIKLIKRHVEQVPNLELVDTFQNPLVAFELLKKEKIDLIFLDIQMPVLTGIEFVKALQHPPSVIFTTAYRDYAVESFELNIVDYLVKPITFTRFLKAVLKYENQIQKIAPPTPTISTSVPEAPTLHHIYVNANKKHIKINFEDILYIESIKDYVRIHTKETSTMTKFKISEFEKKLPNIFMRIHRSFIVNTHQITAYTTHDVEIGEKEIPIGGSYKKLVEDRLT